VRRKRASLEFVDDGEKVMKGSDGRRRWDVGFADEPSCCREHEGGPDEIERDRAAVELGR